MLQQNMYVSQDKGAVDVQQTGDKLKKRLGIVHSENEGPSQDNRGNVDQKNWFVLNKQGGGSQDVSLQNNNNNNKVIMRIRVCFVFFFHQFFFFFFTTLSGMQDLGSQPGREPVPSALKPSVATTGPPGKALT